jgi:hypothetical protein
MRGKLVDERKSNDPAGIFAGSSKGGKGPKNKSDAGIAGALAVTLKG